MTWLFAAFLCVVTAGGIAPARSDDVNPFTQLLGRWVGQGRLGFKSGDIENIKCRATYFLEDDGRHLRQNIRCASASGKVELKCDVINDDGKLSGTWKELIYNLEGRLEGQVTKHGLRVKVSGKNLAAHMEIIVKGHRQIIEVHFDSATLIGMTLMLNNG